MKKEHGQHLKLIIYDYCLLFVDITTLVFLRLY